MQPLKRRHTGNRVCTKPGAVQGAVGIAIVFVAEVGAQSLLYDRLERLASFDGAPHLAGDGERLECPPLRIVRDWPVR